MRLQTAQLCLECTLEGNTGCRYEHSQKRYSETSNTLAGNKSVLSSCVVCGPPHVAYGPGHIVAPYYSPYGYAAPIYVGPPVSLDFGSMGVMAKARVDGTGLEKLADGNDGTATAGARAWPHIDAEQAMTFTRSANSYTC